MSSEVIVNEIYTENFLKDTNKTKGNRIYKLQNKEGTCLITKYKLFDGLYVFFNEINISRVTNKMNLQKESFEINHCREGRFECTLKDGTVTYIKPGDFAINPLKNRSSGSFFPISHYRGVSIYVIPSELSKEARVLENMFGINYRDILARLCSSDKVFIKRATLEIEYIFHDIYNLPKKIIFPYLKVKVQELFLYLSTIDPKKSYRGMEYFTKSNADIVKKIHEYIKKNMQNHYTHEELSSMFAIKQTTMKRCYKAIYGETIYNTLLKTRLKRAAELLKTTSNNILDIALSVGYSSNAKFSTAFKKLYNISPSQYRKISDESDKNGRIGQE